MIKKYLIYIGITVALGVISIVIYNNDKAGTLKVESSVFAVTDTMSISTIRLSDGISELAIVRQGNGWNVNNVLHARSKAVKALLNVIANLEVSSPVSKSMLPDVLNNFTYNALLVTVESLDGVLKEYKITENDSLRIGSFAMLIGDNTPYVVRIAGYDGRISKLFPLDYRFWRDNTLFSYRLADILSVEIEYTLHPENSFAYQFFGITDMKIKQLSSHKILNIEKNTARNFLLNFSALPYQLIDKQQSKHIYDSLILQKPFCEIRVKNIENKTKTVKTYQMPDTKNLGKININFMYAIIQDDTEPVIVKYVDLDPIMKSFTDFSSK